MSENKTLLLSCYKPRCEKCQGRNWKVNIFLPNIPTDNISVLNVLIYAGAKLACDKTGISRRNPNRNIKRTSKEITMTSKDTKEGKNIGMWTESLLIVAENNARRTNYV